MLNNFGKAGLTCITIALALVASAQPQSSGAPAAASQSTATAPAARMPRVAVTANAQAAPPPGYFKSHTVTGMVVDGKGKPVKGATVTLVDPGTNFKATPVVTDKKGSFSFNNLISASYKLQASKGGHYCDPVELVVGDANTVSKDLVLK